MAELEGCRFPSVSMKIHRCRIFHANEIYGCNRIVTAIKRFFKPRFVPALPGSLRVYTVQRNTRNRMDYFFLCIIAKFLETAIIERSLSENSDKSRSSFAKVQLYRGNHELVSGPQTYFTMAFWSQWRARAIAIVIKLTENVMEIIDGLNETESRFVRARKTLMAQRQRLIKNIRGG